MGWAGGGPPDDTLHAFGSKLVSTYSGPNMVAGPSEEVPYLVPTRARLERREAEFVWRANLILRVYQRTGVAPRPLLIPPRWARRDPLDTRLATSAGIRRHGPARDLSAFWLTGVTDTGSACLPMSAMIRALLSEAGSPTLLSEAASPTLLSEAGSPASPELGVLASPDGGSLVCLDETSDIELASPDGESSEVLDFPSMPAPPDDEEAVVLSGSASDASSDEPLIASAADLSLEARAFVRRALACLRRTPSQVLRALLSGIGAQCTRKFGMAVQAVGRLLGVAPGAGAAPVQPPGQPVPPLAPSDLLSSGPDQPPADDDVSRFVRIAIAAAAEGRSWQAVERDVARLRLMGSGAVGGPQRWRRLRPCACKSRMRPISMSRLPASASRLTSRCSPTRSPLATL